MSVQMNQVLADAYGTLSGEQSQEEAEKVAVAQYITKMAAADNIDLNTLTDEQVQVVATHYLQEIEKQAAAPAEQPAPAGDLDDSEKRAAAEMAEADFLGRMMAHSFVQELDGIQKQAAAQVEAPADEIPEAYVKLAEQRAMEFLQEKVAAGELCQCGNPDCNGVHEEKTAGVEYIDALAAQMLDQAGFGKFLQ